MKKKLFTHKVLLTEQPGIAAVRIYEMKALNLQLVIP